MNEIIILSWNGNFFQIVESTLEVQRVKEKLSNIWANKFFAVSRPNLFQKLNIWIFSVTSRHFSNQDQNIKQISCVNVPSLMVCVRSIFHLWFKKKFDFWKLSSLPISSLLNELTILSRNANFFRIVESTLEVQRVKEKFSDSLWN